MAERNAILNVIDYLYDDERKDYESYEVPPEEHILLDIRTLLDFLNKEKERSVTDWFKTDDLSQEVKFKKSPLDNRKKNT